MENNKITRKLNYDNTDNDDDGNLKNNTSISSGIGIDNIIPSASSCSSNSINSVCGGEFGDINNIIDGKYDINYENKNTTNVSGNSSSSDCVVGL